MAAFSATRVEDFFLEGNTEILTGEKKVRRIRGSEEEVRKSRFLDPALARFRVLRLPRDDNGN